MAIDIEATDCGGGGGGGGGGVFAALALGAACIGGYGYGMYSIVPFEFCSRSYESRFGACNRRGYDDTVRPYYEEFDNALRPENSYAAHQFTVYHDGEWVTVTDCSKGDYLFKKGSPLAWFHYSSDTYQESANVIPSYVRGALVTTPLPNAEIFPNKGEYIKDPICFKPDGTQTIADVKSLVYLNYLGNFSDDRACSDKELCNRFAKRHWGDSLSDAPIGFSVMLIIPFLICNKDKIGKCVDSAATGCTGVTDSVASGCTVLADSVANGCNNLADSVTNGCTVLVDSVASCCTVLKDLMFSSSSTALETRLVPSSPDYLV